MIVNHIVREGGREGESTLLGEVRRQRKLIVKHIGGREGGREGIKWNTLSGRFGGGRW